MKIILLTCFGLLHSLALAQNKPVFEAGAATSNITPPLGMEIVRPPHTPSPFHLQLDLTPQKPIRFDHPG
jgi:hypothetical protein